MARSTRAEWQRRVDAWEASGLSAREFAQNAGLNLRTLYYWRWKLKADDGSGEAEVLGPGPSSFVEIHHQPAFPQERFEVVLSSGCRLVVPNGFDDEQLTRLVAALKEAG